MHTRQDQFEALKAAGLTDRQVQCLYLWAVERRSYAAIGRTFGIDEAAVRRHVRAAQANLKRAGLPAAKRCEKTDRPREIATDPFKLDQLSPGQIRAQW